MVGKAEVVPLIKKDEPTIEQRMVGAEIEHLVKKNEQTVEQPMVEEAEVASLVKQDEPTFEQPMLEAKVVPLTEKDEPTLEQSMVEAESVPLFKKDEPTFEQHILEAEVVPLVKNDELTSDVNNAPHDDESKRPSLVLERSADVNHNQGEEETRRVQDSDQITSEPYQTVSGPETALESTPPEQQLAPAITNAKETPIATSTPAPTSTKMSVQSSTNIDETSLSPLPEDLDALGKPLHREETADHIAPTVASNDWQAQEEEFVASAPPEDDLDVSYGLEKIRKRAQKARALDIEDEIAESAPKVISEPALDQSVGKQTSKVDEPSSILSDVKGDVAATQNVQEISETFDRRDSEHVATTDKVLKSISPEVVHKRAFSEEAGPDVSLEEEEAMEPPSKTTRTDDSSPPSQTIVAMEEEALSASPRLSKNSKKLEKGNFPSLDRLEEVQPAIEQSKTLGSQSDPIVDPDIIVPPQQVQRGGLFEEPAMLDSRSTPTKALAEPMHGSLSPAQVGENVVGTARKDDAGELPVQKSKRGKKKRKGSVRIHSEPEIVEVEPSFTPTPIEAVAPTNAEEAKPSAIRSGVEQTYDVPESEDLQGQTWSRETMSEMNDNANKNLLDSTFSEPPKGLLAVGKDASRDLKEQQPEVPTKPEDNTAATSATVKKNKKGKRGKKQQKPYIWEDETATAPAFLDTDQYPSDPATPVQKAEPPSSEGYFELDRSLDQPKNRIPNSASMVAVGSLDSDKQPLSSAEVSRKLGEDSIEAPLLDGNPGERKPFNRTDALYKPVISSHPGDSDQVSQAVVRSAERIPTTSLYSPEARLTEHDRVKEEQLLEGKQPEPERELAYTKETKKGKDRVQQAMDLEPPDAGMATETDLPNDSSISGAERNPDVRTIEFEGELAGTKTDPSATEATAATTILGTGAVLAHGLGRASSKRGKKDKKKKRQGLADEAVGYMEESPPPEPLRDSENIVQAYQPVVEHTPPKSPSLEDHAQPHLNAQRGSVQLDRPINRDSAVHIFDPPFVSETTPVHRPVRDSGYQGTEASPVVGWSVEEDETGLERRSKLGRLSTQGHEKHDPHENEWDMQLPETTRSDSHDVSMNVGSDPDLPPILTREEILTSRTPPFNESRSFEQLRTDNPAQNQFQEPSPASSTSKDRASVLFQSAHATENDITIPSIDERTTSPAARSPHAVPIQAHPASRQPLFEGPVGSTSDVLSPPTSPIPRDGSPDGRLETIREYSPEESPLRTKDRWPSSDIGSPERGPRSRPRTGSSQHQVRSPPALEPSRADMISTDDMISRMPWPSVDEDQHSVDLERSRSRTADRQVSGQQSVVSAAGMPARGTEGEVRSFSGASVRSGESINAIIRTPPDQVRSASGLSYRSGTPPLRRVDRSLSGDLREANRKSDAKKRAKAEAGLPAIAIASSSTYDPTKDKGKTKVREMADVYVSHYSECTCHESRS